MMMLIVLLIISVCWISELHGFSYHRSHLCYISRKNVIERRRLYSLKMVKRVLEDEYDGDSDDDDLEEDDSPSPPNPIRVLVDKVFQKLFFFGLEDDPAPDLEKSGGMKYDQILASKEFQDFKRENLGNLFLTTDELVAQFISSQRSGKLQLSSDKRRRKESKNKQKVSISSDQTSSTPKDTMEAEIIPRQPAAIEQKIQLIEREIKLIDISLAALEDEETAEEVIEESKSLQRKRKDLEEQLNLWKITLITIREEEAELMQRR